MLNIENNFAEFLFTLSSLEKEQDYEKKKKIQGKSIKKYFI